MSWKKVKLKQILKQYRIEHLVQNDTEYKQVTISKYDGVTFRGTKMGREIGRKRQFQIDLEKFPNTLMFVRQGVQDGSIGIAPMEVDGCIATENMPMFSVEGINLEYLKFLLKSPYFYDELNKIQTTGSAQKSIHEREILEIEIPFPDIEEQEDIVQQLTSKKDNSLEISTELTHQLTLVKKLRQQLLQDAVQGKLVAQNPKDEPASELLKKIKAEKEKLIAENLPAGKAGKLKKEKELPPIKPSDIPFEIPENWVWCRLGEISYITSGSTPSQTAFVESGIPYLKMYNLRNQKIDFFHKPQYIKEEVHNGQLKRCRAYSGDIIMNIVGPPLGKIAIIPDDLPECNFNQAAVLIRPLKKEMNHFIFWYLNELSEIRAIETKGVAGQDNISVTQAHNMRVPLPPLAEQNCIVQKLDELMQCCNELEASIKLSESQNEKLLQQVLREALRKEPVEV
jgi:restriction endonuclease S subunit